MRGLTIPHPWSLYLPTMIRAICFDGKRLAGAILVVLLILCISAPSLSDKSEKALIIAPHCDDETLSCGGLINRLAKEGVPIRVVIITNGDGFDHPVKDVDPGPAGFIELGHKRQKESLSALEKLGVPGSSVAFLGYPDRGLAMMWLYFWDKPYKSRYTRCTSSPYEMTFHPNAPYYGRSLLYDLEVILKRYRPTTVYYPHPLDIHTDHWAVNCFVTQALYEADVLDKVKSCLYIVHGADQVLAKGYETKLSTTESEAKRSAIDEYKTQLPVMGKWLENFSKDSEVFRPETICAITRARAKEWPDWSAVPESVLDPARESKVAGALPGGDITEFKSCYDDDFVYAWIKLAHEHSKWLTYRFSLVGMPDEKGRRANVSVTEKGCTGSGARGRMEGNTVEIAIPKSRLGKWTALLVSADTSIFRQKVDRTAWQVLERGGSSKLLPGPQSAGLLPPERRHPAHRSP